MKKLLAIILAVMMCLVCFAGCGGSDEEKTDDKSSKKTSTNSKTEDKNTDKTDDKTEDENKKEEEAVKGEPLAMEYDDYITFENAKVIVSKNEDIVKGTGNTLRALKLTEEPIAVAVHNKDGSVENYDVTVKKAKINIVLICGQSNASGETTGVPANGLAYKCATVQKGVGYMWNAASTSPSGFYGGGKDAFRAALAQEWYEQSKAAGAPEKTCFVFQNDYTATPGERISEFLDDNGSRGTVKKSVKMVNDCYDYYTTGNGKDNFEVVGCGMYWLQGESDSNETESYYLAQFNTLWSRLKSETGGKLKYCGIMRVRKGNGFQNLGASGPVTAQKKLAETNADIFMASVITENWSGKAADQMQVDISNYHIFDEAQYSNIVSGNTLTERLDSIYGGLHYSPLGYNILGADAAYNMYKILRVQR